MSGAPHDDSIERAILGAILLNPEVRDLFGFRYEDFELMDYRCHEHIRAAVAV